MRGHGSEETPGSLARRYEEQARIQRSLVRDLSGVQAILRSFEGVFQELFSDDHFVTLLRAEHLGRVPKILLRKRGR